MGRVSRLVPMVSHSTNAYCPGSSPSVTIRRCLQLDSNATTGLNGRECVSSVAMSQKHSLGPLRSTACT